MDLGRARRAPSRASAHAHLRMDCGPCTPQSGFWVFELAGRWSGGHFLGQRRTAGEAARRGCFCAAWRQILKRSPLLRISNGENYQLNAGQALDLRQGVQSGIPVPQ
jgi:hypothetical protein